jgi:hypothetical protein
MCAMPLLAFREINLAGAPYLLRRFPAALVNGFAAMQAHKPGFIPFKKGDKEKVEKGVRKNKRGGGIPSAARTDDIVYFHDLFLPVFYPENTYKKHNFIVARAVRAINNSFFSF